MVKLALRIAKSERPVMLSKGSEEMRSCKAREGIRTVDPV